MKLWPSAKNVAMGIHHDVIPQHALKNSEMVPVFTETSKSFGRW